VDVFVHVNSLRAPLCGALAGLLVLASLARADSVLVAPEYFSGARTTPTGLGINSTGNWKDQGVKIQWNITESSGIFTYQYTLSTIAGGSLIGAVSHFILETSEAFTHFDILPGSNPVSDPQWWTPAMPSNPNMPAPIWGVKFDFGSGTPTYTLVTTKRPVWGDFYTKDGKAGRLGFNAAWNAGLAIGDPTLSTTDFTAWIPTPDTLAVEPPPTVPLPAAAWMGLSLLGASTLVTYSRRRRACLG
jgi:hypothetical protein